MKTCSICKEDKTIDNFYSNGMYKDKPKYKPFCKQCEMKTSKENMYKILTKAYERPLACSICGYNKNPAALDFHHIDPTLKEFRLNGKHLSFQTVKTEIDKCICLCSNCHRELHYPQWNNFMVDSAGVEPATYPL